MNKILFICLSSYQPQGQDYRQRYGRQELYSISLNQLIKDTPGFADICVVENTVADFESIENIHLKTLLQSESINYKFFINDNRLGSANKGAGEFTMCMHVVEQLKDKIKQYDWVVYFTSRHILYKLPDFLNLLKNSTDDVIVANPSFILPNRTLIKCAPGNYNDMLFAMRPNIFQEYCISMNPQILVKEKMNSESHLYNFIKSRASSIKIKELQNLWICRYDYGMNHMHLNSNDPESYNEFNEVVKIYNNFYLDFPENDILKESLSDSPINIKIIDNNLGIFTRLINFFSFKSKLCITLSEDEYTYDIEPVWKKIEARIDKTKAVNVIFPENNATAIYKNRLTVYLKK